MTKGPVSHNLSPQTLPNEDMASGARDSEEILAVGRYRTTRLVHASHKTTIYLAESAMGDTVVLKRCDSLQAERERAQERACHQ